MNIKISKNSHSCAACGNDFQHEQELTSTVKVAEGVLHRLDFCRDCWNSEQSKDAYSVWSMVYHDPKVENQEPAEVFSPLRQLFYEAAEEQSRIEMAKAFLAAGLLRRQKVFRLIKESDESDGDVRITLYTDRIGNRLIEVPDPQFTYAEMDKARALLIERLQVLELAAAGPPPESVVASPPTKGTAEPEDDSESPEKIDSLTAPSENEGEPGEEIPEDRGEDEDEDEFDDDEDDDDDEEDDDEEEDEDDDDEEEDDDDDDEDEDDEEDEEDGDEDGDELDEVEDDQEREVKVMESALAGSGSTDGYTLGKVTFANEEALHAQA
jgi:hypothetical protein